MCFHTSQTKKVVELKHRFNVNLYDDELRDDFDIPSYHLNGFVHPDMLLIPQEEPSILTIGRWGIAPSKTQPEDLSNYYKDATRFGGGLNAQSEKLFNHFIYKHSALTKRCLIPVTGFYEPHEYKSKKYPYYIHRTDNEALALAGLYTHIGEYVTFTILTKDASPMFAEIHNKRKRQPIILKQEFEKEWLRDDLNENCIKELINLQFNDEELEAYTVSRDLFSPKIISDIKSITNNIKYPELVTLF
ncbi:SOS response-associated peptidase [Flavobacteriaceae bacterium PRS1]|nr:SOS response-associated peptidase [Flavobacteriaceae bacterium PRS1]